MKLPTVILSLLLLAPPALADDMPADEMLVDEMLASEGIDATAAELVTGDDDETPNGDGIESPKTMSGMSILGNEEAPKALVIVPWKSSELGEAISLTDTLDDRAKPVDKDVFLRELRFYEIRSAE